MNTTLALPALAHDLIGFVVAVILFSALLLYRRVAARTKVAQEKAADDRRKLDYQQYVVNRKYVAGKLRAECEKLVAAKAAKMPAAKFAVGDIVRVDCRRENFAYGWVCLGEPFKVGQDELAEVQKVAVNAEFLWEVLCEDYRRDSFHRFWEQRMGHDLDIHDVDSPEFAVKVQEFAANIPLDWDYYLKFENPAINIRWAVAEKFIAHPIGVQVA